MHFALSLIPFLSADLEKRLYNLDTIIACGISQQNGLFCGIGDSHHA